MWSCFTGQSPSLPYGHELWVVTKGMRWWIQPREMSFLRAVAGLCTRERVHVGGAQRRDTTPPDQRASWGGSDIGLGFLLDTSWVIWSQGRSRTHWRDYMYQLAWERLDVPLDKLKEVAGEKEVRVSLFRLLPPRSGPAQVEENGWIWETNFLEYPHAWYRKSWTENHLHHEVDLLAVNYNSSSLVVNDWLNKVVKSRPRGPDVCSWWWWCLQVSLKYSFYTMNTEPVLESFVPNEESSSKCWVSENKFLKWLCANIPHIYVAVKSMEW